MAVDKRIKGKTKESLRNWRAEEIKDTIIKNKKKSLKNCCETLSHCIVADDDNGKMCMFTRMLVRKLLGNFYAFKFTRILLTN